MKLIGELKEKVEQAESKEEVRETIAQAGILLDDEELENVAGGIMPTIQPCFRTTENRY